MENTLIIYISLEWINKKYIEDNFEHIKKIYLEKFDLDVLKKTLSEFEYMIYLNDDTNYSYDNLSNDVSNGLNVLVNDCQIHQLLFNDYICVDIDDKIINYDKNYIENEITIFSDEYMNSKNCSIKSNLTKSNINYIDYVKSNFPRLFIPSIIKTSIFVNYYDKLINEPHYELNFLKKVNLKKFTLRVEPNIIFNEIKLIENINDDLTIVTGFIKLDEKKIQKYERQKYEYLETCDPTLKLNINMVIYVSSELENHVYEKRKEFGLIDKTKIIVVELNKHMYFYNKLDIVANNVKKNHHNYSSAKKILTVMSRYNYLKDTIEKNYFDSKYFAWLDFGASHIVNIPDNIIFNDNFDNKIKIGWISRFDKSQFVYNHKVLSGGFFIGKSDAIKELIKLHNKYFEIVMNYGFTINDDKLLFFIFENNPFMFKTYFTDYKSILTKCI